MADHPALDQLRARSGGACELCTSPDAAGVHEVDGSPASGAEACVLVCETCATGLAGEAIDDKHWFALQDSAWSEVQPVQVTVWRQLARLREPWAQDLHGQIWLPDEVTAWAKQEEDDDGELGFKDVNGVPLQAGDNATIIKDLPVKGGGFTAKRGTAVRNVRLTSDPTHIEAKVNGVTIYIKTEFLKKA